MYYHLIKMSILGQFYEAVKERVCVILFLLEVKELYIKEGGYSADQS